MICILFYFKFIQIHFQFRYSYLYISKSFDFFISSVIKCKENYKLDLICDLNKKKNKIGSLTRPFGTKLTILAPVTLKFLSLQFT